MKKILLVLILTMGGLFFHQSVLAQRINHLKVDNLDLIYFGKRYSYLLSHVSQTYRNAMNFHNQFWNYRDTTTYVKSSLFGTHLMTNFDRSSDLSHIFNVGGQVDVQLVLLSYLKTTWSFGYGKKIEDGRKGTDQFMLSLKLLGD
jgi:hypothetical protein